MKTKIITLALISGLFLVGCDSSSTQYVPINAESTDTTLLTDIKVERGPVLNAAVRVSDELLN